VNALIRFFFTTAALVTLSLSIPPSSRVQAQCTFTNGNFESGNLSGWTQFNRSNDIGNWYNYTGTTTPLSFHTISAPPQGTRAATTDQNAATTHVLYQDFTFPAGQSGTLSFYLAYNNTHTSFITLNTLDYTGNQQARVDLIKTTAGNESIAVGDVLVKLFQTKPGDPNVMAPTLMTFDVSGFAGTTTRLRFAEAVGLNYFPVAVDNVCLSTTRTTITRTTPTGTNVKTSFGGVELTFPAVAAAGITSLTQLDPAAQTNPPPGDTFTGPAYDISTAATVTAPINVCMYLPGITDANTFSHLRMLHKVGGVWVDLPSRINLATRTLCATTPTLSPFAVAHNPLAPTAAGSRITGRITDEHGAAVAGATVRLSGAQNRKFITDRDGNYHFDQVETAGFYTVTPSQTNYSFTPAEHSFSQLGNETEAAFTAVANVASENLLDTPEYFVRQHYLDFLAREPDEAGFNFWSDQISSCGSDAGCAERKRINVSAAYFLSVEFQQTGGLVNSAYRLGFGRAPRYDEFIPDAAEVGREVVVGRKGWEQQIATNKQSFIAGFVQRPQFRDAYDSLSNDRYVEALTANAGVSFSQTERDELVNGLNAGSLTRAAVFQQLAENERFVKAGRNQAFVMMQYFGYLRRDPDPDGYGFWLRKLEEFHGNFEQAEMVKAFINSSEYRARFVR